MKKILKIIGIIWLILLVYCLVAKGEDDWKQKAEFFASNFPDVTNNEKAKMIMASMDNEGAKYSTQTKEYTVKVIFIYDVAGRRIWPATFSKREDGMTDFQLIEERAKEIDGLFKKKSKEEVNECVECTKGSCNVETSD